MTSSPSRRLEGLLLQVWERWSGVLTGKLSICARKVVHLIFGRRGEVVQLTIARREKLSVLLGVRRKKVCSLHGETGVFGDTFMAVACFLGLKR